MSRALSAALLAGLLLTSSPAVHAAPPDAWNPPAPNELKAGSSAPAPLPVHHKPDLVAQDPIANPQIVHIGASFQVTFKVKNIGAGASAASTARVLVWPSGGPDGPKLMPSTPPVVLKVLPAVQALAPGQEVTVSSGPLTFPAGAPGGVYLVQCTADFPQQLSESNESNNVSPQNGQVKLVVRGASLGQ